MARSLSNVRVFSGLLVDGISNNIARRGYAAASNGVVSSVGREMAAKKGGEEGKVAWVPDPVTGYYRPENRADEIDVAELRALLLKNRESNN